MSFGIRALRTPRSALPALAATAVALLLILLGAPAPAQAAAWQCRGSVLSASVAGNAPSEPLVANSGFGPCVDSSAGPQNVGATLGLPANVISAVTAAASTDIRPAGATQAVDAGARVENLSIALGAGAVTLGVRAATARAVGGCASGSPALAGVSEVAGLTVNGNELPLAQAVAQLNSLLAPLGQVVDLRLDEQVRSGATLTQRALHLRVLSGAGTALVDVVAGEARTGADGAVCSGSGSGDDGAAGGGTDPATSVCPAGSTLDAPSGRCVIRETTGGVGSSGVQGTIVVGRPFEGPVGGSVMSLGEARKRYKSVCLRGRGARFVVLGTAKNDRVTGTNQDDRMLLLGGGDRGDGGRGDDCIDGGTGRDVLSGAQDKDRVYGAAGNDSLNGGPARDRLSGGAGNDTINAAYGADRTFGGAGRDAINIATAGPRASASCGAGRDTVRLNGSERRRVRACERRLVLPDRL